MKLALETSYTSMAWTCSVFATVAPSVFEFALERSLLDAFVLVSEAVVQNSQTRTRAEVRQATSISPKSVLKCPRHS